MLVLSYPGDSSYGGSVESNQQAPRFLSEPASRIHFVNTAGVLIHCGQVAGIPSPTVQWVTAGDGQPVTTVHNLRTTFPNGTLYLQSFQANRYRQDVHATTYRCVATNSVGTTGSRDVRVRAVVAQRYEVQVYDEFVISGNTAVLRCHIPSYVRDYVAVVTWEREDGVTITSNVAVGGRYSVLAHGELHIRQATIADGFKSYRCRTRHALSGETQLSATAGRLIITDAQGAHPPRLSDTLAQVRTDEGSAAELTCVAQGFPTPTYRWFRKDNFRPATEARGVIQADGSLYFVKTKIQDSGMYVCVVNNSAGEQILESTLTVTAPLSVHITPERVQVETGRTATLTCNVSGWPVDSITWLRDQRPLHPLQGLETSSSSSKYQLISPHVLHIPSLTRNERGVYQCYARNQQDSAQATSEIVLGEIPPMITDAFKERTIEPGSGSLSLHCIALGTPLPQVTWTLDGLPVQDNERVRAGDYVRRGGDVVSHVNISDIRVSDGGFYACIARSDVGEKVHEARINIRGPPTVRRMEDRYIVAGETVRIQCPYSGHPISEIFWEKDGRRLPTNRRQQVFANGTLVLATAVKNGDEGLYRCTARNKDGTADSGTLRVKVQVKPVLQPFAFPRVIQEGMKVVVTCSVADGDAPFEVTWLRNGSPLPEDSVRVQKYSDDFATLTIEKAQPRHNGDYTCIARNAFAQVNYTSTLTVHVPPRWSIEPKDTDVVVSRSATLDCQAEGYPHPQLRWEKGTGQGNYEPVTTSYHYQIYENGSLTIQDVTKNDAGFYLCQATNDVGPGLSSVISLNVHIAPEFKTKFHTKMVRKDEDVKLTCEVKGDQPIQIQWHKDKLPLLGLASTENAGLAVAKVRDVPITDGTKSELTLSRVGRKDSALYSCVATNKYGTDDTNIQLVVQEPPDPPRSVRIIESSSRRARVQWDPPFSGNSLINQYRIQIMETTRSSGVHLTSPHNMTVTSTETQSPIKNLRPSSSYELVIIAENGVGESLPSVKVPFQTEGEVPEGPPEQISVEPTSSTSLRVSWMPPPVHMHNGDILGYYVGYNSSGEKIQYKTVDVKSSSQPRTETELKGLHKWTRYSVSIQAYNKKGAGPRSDPIVKLTMEDVPSRPPRKVACEAKSSSKVRVTWSPPPHNALHGHLEGFKIRYRKTESHEDEDDEPILEIVIKSGEQQDYNLDSLAKFANYSIQLLARTRKGDGIESDPVYCKTLEDVPGPPGDIKALPYRKQAILVSWKLPEECNGVITTYTLYQRSVGSTDKPNGSHNMSKHQVAASQRYFEATGLELNRRYEFWVSASTQIGEGESTRVMSQSTSDTIPARIASFSERVFLAKGSSMTLNCLSVGVPPGSNVWNFRGEKLDKNKNRFQLLSNGSVLLSEISDEHTGNYTCRVENRHGSDEINYQVQIKGLLPAPSAVSVVSASTSELRIRWDLPRKYMNAMFKLILHYRRKFGGQWEEVEVSSKQDWYLLEGLQCGTKYQVYLVGTRRSGAVGEASDIITGQTEGGVPAAPLQDDFATPSNSSITLDLGTWSDGGCPMRAYVINYRKQQASNERGEWIQVQYNQAQDRVVITGLSPATWYEIKVAASNDAGSQVHIYAVATRTIAGGTIAPALANSFDDGYATNSILEEVQIVVPVIVAVFALTVILTISGYVYVRRRQLMFLQDSQQSPLGNGSGLYERTRAPSTGDTQKKFIESCDTLFSGGSPRHINNFSSTYQVPAKLATPVSMQSQHCTLVRNPDARLQYYEDDIVTPYATFRVAGSQDSDVCARRESAIAGTLGHSGQSAHQTLQMHAMHPGAVHNHHTLGHPGHRGGGSGSGPGGNPGGGPQGQVNGTGPNGVGPPGTERERLDSAQLFDELQNPYQELCPRNKILVCQTYDGANWMNSTPFRIQRAPNLQSSEASEDSSSEWSSSIASSYRQGCSNGVSSLERRKNSASLTRDLMPMSAASAYATVARRKGSTPGRCNHIRCAGDECFGGGGTTVTERLPSKASVCFPLSPQEELTVMLNQNTLTGSAFKTPQPTARTSKHLNGMGNNGGS
ncbi:Down syndrome cell adhesion molecule-like protein Dscam2 isoform X3 [Varroa destructor]|uniref:Down syndrome cell adhesion molecule-like protein Dscam2 n=1 Tax=Varroa destructor TaxID=109461 RepID=A0A7M7L4X5_VARDE|nr:Down syndrome cell adhesion molecule-like protein Dscam2 isoform X3 [Varroa destructor]